MTLVRAAGAALALAWAATGWAQPSSAGVPPNWPNKPITFIVPYAAGGPTDVVARTIAVGMSRAMNNASIVIENKVGAGGTIATAHVAKAAPDGYTFLVHHMAMATYPGLYKSLPFDTLKDFEYVGQVVDVPMTLLGRKDLPASNLKELLPWLSANKEKVNWGNGGKGGVAELCTILFQKQVGYNMTSASFTGTGPAMNALLGGQIDLMCDQTTTTVPQIKAGTVKFYGVTTPTRVKVLPDAPTLDEQGLKGFDMKVWHGVYAPKGTPKPIIDRMSAALRAAMKDPDVVRRMNDLGAEIVSEDKMTSQGLENHVKAEMDKWLPAIRSAGVEPK